VTAAAPTRTAALVDYCLGLGDDALVLSHRLQEWVTRAPQLEEDVALANIALDLLGQARVLLSRAGELEGAGRDEDAMAFWRDLRDYRNVSLVELPDNDFADCMARLLWFSTYQHLLYRELSGSRDEVVAGVAQKAVKEVAYHRDHASQWVVRLGDGTEESTRRMRAALDRTAAHVDALFDSSWVDPALVADGTAVDTARLRPEWEDGVGAVLAQARLERPQVRQVRLDGRRGIHSDALGHVLAEMQHLHRSHPGATW